MLPPSSALTNSLHRRAPPTRWPALLPLAMAALLSLLSVLSLLHLLSLPNSSTAALSPAQIQRACKATRFPDSCVATLSNASSLPSNPSPVELILSAVSASSENLPPAQAMARAILASSGANPNRSNAAGNCVEHLGASARRLAGVAAALPQGRAEDARAWLSAALLYQYDCFSALKYVNDTAQVDDAMRFLLSLTALTSNALSMLAAFQRYGADSAAWAPPQTERDGYWGAAAAAASAAGRARPGGFPSEASTVVCKGGAAAGCYATVQAAVDAAPDFGEDKFVIHIKQGVYEETVRVPFEKTNVVFLGDGTGKTVITGSVNAQMPGVSTYNTATLGVNGDGFMARGLTVQNAAGPGAHQAVAFRSDSDRSVVQEVEILGHQDTLYARSLRQLYRSCTIAGTVDFVFGNAAAVFEDCRVVVRPRQEGPEKGETNAVAAQGRTDPAQATGFVFRGCVVNGTDEYVAIFDRRPAAHRTYLGRPWKEYSRTVFVRCVLERVVRPEGWLPWSGDFALDTLFYGESQSSGPGGGAAGRVPWSSQIPPERAVLYSPETFIQGNDWIPTPSPS
ncbi:plant invertase/pectin methylesterase inhibitor superfamily [Wolffia australiana]